MKTFNLIMAIILIIGGLNWGLIGLNNTDLVKQFFGGTGIDRIIYFLVGLSAIYSLGNLLGIKDSL